MFNVVSDEKIKIGGAETFAASCKNGSRNCPSKTLKPYDWGSDLDDEDDEDDDDLGDLGCAAECLAEQVECQEDCVGTDFGCVARCGAEGLSCQEDCMNSTTREQNETFQGQTLKGFFALTSASFKRTCGDN